MITRLGRFGTAVILLAVTQTLILGWMVWGRITILRSSDVITLESEPVDPRDIFRGDYVTLTYGISRLSLDGMPGDTGFESGDAIYVEITPARDTWRAVAVYRSNRQPREGHKIIRGRITSLVRGAPRVTPIPHSNEMEETPCAACENASISYGVESFFVPEGQGRALEAERNTRALSVDVAIARDGEAAIKGLRIDGKPVYEEPLL
jgi:uncharacterized membrane-anchored protein